MVNEVFRRNTDITLLFSLYGKLQYKKDPNFFDILYSGCARQIETPCTEFTLVNIQLQSYVMATPSHNRPSYTRFNPDV